MWRTDDDLRDGSAAANRLARVVGLPPDPGDPDPPGYSWDAPAPASPPSPSPVAGRSLVAAFDPGRRGVRVLAVVAGIVICVAAFLAWRARPQVTPAPPVAAASPSVAAPSVPAVLVISVTGKVNRPGLVRLPAGSRVADAIEAAGGAAPGADLTGVNLARKLADGEMVAIGVPPQAGGGSVGGGSVGGGGPAGGLVDLNAATAAELQTLPGIGEVLAQRIVDYRDRHGGFHAVSDLRQVEGIGDTKYQQIKDRVTV